MTKFPLSVILVLLVINQIPAASRPTAVDHAVLELPQPDGSYAIGTMTVVLRDTRRNRQLPVTIWYPANTRSVVAPYTDKRTGAELAAAWKLQPGFERGVRTHAGLHAAMAKNGPFPVALLEHGSGTVPSTYTVLAEGLASQGFIVVATNHPPDSLIAVFPDGRELKAKPYWPVDADRRTQGVAIGRFVEDVLVVDADLFSTSFKK